MCIHKEALFLWPGFGSGSDAFGFGRMDLMSGSYGPRALSKARKQ